MQKDERIFLLIKPEQEWYYLPKEIQVAGGYSIGLFFLQSMQAWCQQWHTTLISNFLPGTHVDVDKLSSLIFRELSLSSGLTKIQNGEFKRLPYLFKPKWGWRERVCFVLFKISSLLHLTCVLTVSF